jgi:hypothetical protein
LKIGEKPKKMLAVNVKFFPEVSHYRLMKNIVVSFNTEAGHFLKGVFCPAFGFRPLQFQLTHFVPSHIRDSLFSIEKMPRRRHIKT